ncbi:bifunctional [glutamate--ammonia ligase]-adenylyl-L-tyrosine phosphorylase/[glutamate--ammonia-ligase] adenylyltransferase [Halioxenophilus sp. WMMB6]|uniref:bifunctional [glutamate--ammonia ligase]-adenylyl-L-tyrosine phosphorylase/[glutamate--ammonia-ligase] adenylyltransferase n=1 Tax=Halioxenophilus sp. WMMB6 TaxID=3073815 RepID=UPI00295F19C2|nr:bifunctional [glutamate--ammonia ligase]-adenylyl-L-tyrosine phosphorylase/[glutamate--ammonia-ligase] adenylyltransferase [Halioxenophilus sp. WMMB6]
MSQIEFTDSDAAELVVTFWQALAERHGDPLPITDEALSASSREQLGRCLAGSLYAREQLLARPEWLLELAAPGGPLPATDDYYERLQAGLATLVADLPTKALVTALDALLRRERARAMVAIIWAELNQLTSVTDITEHLSALAAACLQTALDCHYQLLADEVGSPIGANSGQLQPLLVLGMGKLGAWELNLSSDIDLIFVFPESGETRAQAGQTLRKTLSNQEFFTRLGQRLIKSLDAQTADGFVFRVDMRLRPWGQSGPLATTFSFLEDYYQNQGREWERYAMIKARVVAASALPGIDQAYRKSCQKQLMAVLRPFSYRRYVDFSVINALREMKALINREVKLRRKTEDVKLGYGGIREVEFIAQVFQLVRGGREQQLQERRLLKVLPRLQELGHLPAAVVAELDSAYLFLRRVEHAIQAWDDRQTQALPNDREQQARMAYVLGFASWPDFHTELERVRSTVNREFQSVVGESAHAEVPAPALPLSLWQAVCQGQPDEELLEIAEAVGLNPASAAIEKLQRLAAARVLTGLPPQSCDRLDRLIAQLLQAIVELDWRALSWPDLPSELDDAELLARTLPLMETIARRSAYLVLLLENPGVLPHLLRLFAASSWIAQEITSHPALLEELLDAASLHSVPEPSVLRSELEQELLAIPADDLEQQMEALRYFRRAHALRVAACEVSGSLTLMKVSDYLTWVAEQLLKQVLEIAWADMIGKYGWPGDERGTRLDKGFVVVAYGKMGGIEMAHGSDLDLVFIHDCDQNGCTDGAKSIDTQTFYTRLGQKIIHILNTRTPSGRLYEVDMRLRPSGNSGLLVTSLAAFERYQREQAWTWEHQALLRARPVAGSDGLAEQFQALRTAILCQRRDPKALCQQVVEMRAKMRAQLGSKPKEDNFHIKQDAGGMVDIEFLVQYTVLAWAADYPQLVHYTDNMRILESMGSEGLLATDEVQLLMEAYINYRSAGHRLALQNQPGVVGGDQFLAAREQVQRIWARYLAMDV